MATRSKQTATRRTTKKAAGAAKPTPTVLVLRAPGTNCERETAFAFEVAGARTRTMHIGALLEKPRTLRRMQGLALPGGFSYGDDLGAGRILGAFLRTQLLDEIKGLVDRGGVVLGICNGFQILAQSGLLPGAEEGARRTTTLATNQQNRYEDRWVKLRAETDRCVFFRKGDEIACPVAHAEGRFLTKDEAELERLRANGQVALRYVAPGDARPAGFPHNPNGAVDDIAGICDETGRILGLMPHPERNQFPFQDPRFHAGEAPKKPEGLLPFQRAVRHLKRAFS